MMPDFPIATCKLATPKGERLLRHFDTPMDRKTVKWVFGGDSYPLFTLNRKVTRIVDIGANVGAAAIMFWMNYPEARIHCFEPSPETYGLLLQNTEDIPNIHRHNVAVDRKAGKGKLYHRSSCSVMDSMRMRETDDAPFTECEVVSVLEYLPCDILKVDTEGLEFDILLSLRDKLPQVGVVYVEAHHRYDRMAIDQLLGYTHALLYAKVATSNQIELAYVRDDWLEKEKK